MYCNSCRAVKIFEHGIKVVERVAALCLSCIFMFCLLVCLWKSYVLLEKTVLKIEH